MLLDVVFDRIPEERLAGDRARGVEHLVRQQGFYIADALAERLGPTRVVLACDFSGDPQRLETLRKRLPGLVGLREGAGIDELVETLLRES